MKPDSVAKFDPVKARRWLDNFIHSKVMLDDKQKQIAWYIDKVLEAGLVPPEQESKKDTIEISRSVAEEWLRDMSENTFKFTDHSNMAEEVRKALSEGRNS